MDFKTAKINWQDILKDQDSWIIYTHKQWRTLVTSDDSQNIDWIHWRNTSPTFARYRVITLEWISDRIWNELENQNSLEYLQNLFALQWDLSQLEEKELYIKDMYDNEWILKVKIKEPLTILEWDENIPWSHWKWRVVLESLKLPIYKSLDEIIKNWTEWNTWWFYLWTEFPTNFNETDGIIECTTSWNISTPAKVEITARSDIDSPLIIRNITNNTFFSLDIDAVDWDIIIIDSNDYTVTKNWENILANRISWSTWLQVEKTTQIIVEDKDWNIPFNDFDINIYFRNALL